MSVCGCNYKCNCALAALVVSLILGVIAAFLQITGVITVTMVFLWVLFGIAVGLLGTLVLASAVRERNCGCSERCSTLNTVLAGVLGTILFSVILLAVGITATSVISAILVGLLVFSFSLTMTALACHILCAFNCAE